MPNPANKIIFTKEQHQFLIDNYLDMTNQELANALGLKLTRVRMELSSLGLKRMEMEYWPDEAVDFLRDNYHKIGDREIVRIFKNRFPKKKGWSTRHVQKKLSQLGLKRNKMDWYCIKERNRDNGSYGRRNTNNSPNPPKVFISIGRKTKVLLEPGQSIEDVLERYESSII